MSDATEYYVHFTPTSALPQGASSMSFGMYMVGYIILIVGLAIGAHLLHLPPRWIGVGIICMMGIGILTGVTATRHRDPPA
jgi:hypothetical protein